MLPKADHTSIAKPLVADESARSLTLCGQVISYTLRRSCRRSIGLSIDHRGLRVGAPRHASLREVELLIHRHAEWVTQKLEEWSRHPQEKSLQIVDGMQLRLLGKPLRIRLVIGGNRAIWNELADPVLTLCLRTPAEASRLLERTLRAKALEFFDTRLSPLAEKMGLSVPRLTLSSARTRWGSCSQKSGIRLNWRLVHFAPHVIDYVIIHELAHLIEMNHSQRFWTIVSRYCPEYRNTRAELNQQAATLPCWR